MLNESYKLYDKLCEIRRTLHNCPETGFALEKTFNTVWNLLVDIGYKPQKCGKKGIVATIGNIKGRCVLLRADMDALPIKEDEYSSEKVSGCEENMHACGHDMHTTMLIGAAILLKKYENELNGCVKLMFQPAEEILMGAKDMIDNGVLESPEVNYALMIHVLTNISLKTGSAIFSPPGAGAPSADYFKVTVSGKGGHGAMPSQCRDALLSSAYIIASLCEINARELSFGEKALITVGKINSSGEANVISEKVSFEGTLRTYSEETRLNIKKRISEISNNIAAAFLTRAETSFGGGAPLLINDKELSEKVTNYTRELLGCEKVIEIKNEEKNGAEKNQGSEDFAHISHRVPSIMIALAAGNISDGYNVGLHNSKTRFDEGALPVGAAIYAYNAMQLLNS